MSTTETMNMEETTPIIPKTCKAGVVCNPGPDFTIEVQDIPVPEIGPEEVLIKLNVTGLCMSDVHFMMEDWGLPPMQVQRSLTNKTHILTITRSQFGTKCAGHEGAGVIVKIGERVKNLKIGQRAGLKPIQDVCHTCEYCKTGKETYCLNSVMTGLHIDGSYKQYIVSPERYTSLIPDGVPDEIAGPIMCSGSTAYTSIKESGLRPGQWAVFPGGGGGVGMQAVQLAIAMGLRAIVIDTGAERKEACLKFGADEFIDFKEVENPVERVVELTGAVQSYPIAQGFLGNRAGAQVMCIGLPPAGKYNMEVNPSTLAFRNQSIKGTLVAGMADVDETMDFARRGKLRLEPTVVGLSKFNESVQKLKNGQVAGRIVVDFNKD
ncbi:alcohol dehydrogenase [Aureobasidium sp. EXF-8845]|nr:alcohol dehydrogenase [Aureobasidium sp. EXF-8845]